MKLEIQTPVLIMLLLALAVAVIAGRSKPTVKATIPRPPSARATDRIVRANREVIEEVDNYVRSR